MATQSDRLRRLVSEQLDDCCDADVDRRFEELEALSRSVPEDGDADRAALSTLSDKTRYRIARYLAAAEGELCVCELSPIVDVSASAVSHALSDLSEADLVTRRSDGNWRFYDATERTEALLETLSATREGEK